MKITSMETYKIVRAILRRKKFTQYEISKKEKLTFSLVNRVVNWLTSRGYIAKRKGHYALVSASVIFNLFPLYRQLKSFETLDVSISRKEALKMIKGKAALCLISALSFHDDYYRDSAIYAYVLNEKLADELKELPKGLTHIELFREDLNPDDFEIKKGTKMTNKARTIIDLFCANKAYAVERLIKKEYS